MYRYWLSQRQKQAMATVAWKLCLSFIEAGGQAAELLEVAEGAFDATALFVESASKGALELARCAGQNGGSDVICSRVVRDWSVW